MSPPDRRLRSLLLPWLALLPVACGTQAGPTWTVLADGFTPRPLVEVVGAWEREAGASGETRVEQETLGISLWHDVAAYEWEPQEGGGSPTTFTTAIPPGAFLRAGVQPRLLGRGGELPRARAGEEPQLGQFSVKGGRLSLRQAANQNRVPPTLLLLRLGENPPEERPIPSSLWTVGLGIGSFFIPLPPDVVLEGDDAPRLFHELTRVDEERALELFEYRVEEERVLLRWSSGQAPPAMRLTSWLENGREVDGLWQLRLGRTCALGIPVWGGGREELACDLPANSRLSFRFLFQSGASNGPARARVSLDGEELWTLERPWEPNAEPLHVELEIEAAHPGARLAFELEADSGLGAFFTPVLGPSAHGTPQERPWESRPDVVILLADTLRADSLAMYGGAPDLTPELNRLAEASLRFPDARSNAAWTLPSISTLLTGLQPGQHGATDENLTLAASHDTLAERMARAGYRTGAITDGSFFSPVFGLDQGFEWFSQRDPQAWDLDATVAEARAFLQQDDGRPVFLVVHTYRVHQPYRTGPEEDRGAYDELMARTKSELGTDSPTPRAGFDALHAHADELRELYEAGVRDLDRGLGLLLAELEARRFFEHGLLIFTSDHGEALGENHEFFHSGQLWETKLRIPLLLRGAGIEPGSSSAAASLVDVAPTIAALSGIPADSAWPGVSLLEPGAARPTFAFQLVRKNRQVALVEGSRKVILTPERALLEAGRCEQAFQLDEDPSEARNLAQESDWPAELTRRFAPLVLQLLEARAVSERAGISPELREQLDGLGYGGGE